MVVGSGVQVVVAASLNTPPPNLKQDLAMASLLILPRERLGFVRGQRAGGVPEQLDATFVIFSSFVSFGCILVLFDLFESHSGSAIEVMRFVMVEDLCVFSEALSIVNYLSHCCSKWS